MKKIHIPIDKLVEQYRSGYSTKYLSEFYNCSVITIQRKLRKSNCEFRPIGHGCKKYNINENYFDIINTENKAYWLGIMLTDGSTSSKMIRLGFKKSDEKHLEKFLRDLSSNHPIKHQKKEEFTQSYVSIGNKHMRESLMYKGIVVNNKKVFNVLKELEKHYWRGAIDGDGKVDLKNKTIGIVGEKDVCESFRSFCIKNVKTQSKVKKHDNIWSYRLHGNIAFDIARLLYDGSSISLDRKHQEFLLWSKTYDKKPLYPKVVRFFKNHFSEVDLSVRKCTMPKTLEGECVYKNNKYLIRINKCLSDNEAINCLLHELSHINTMLAQKDPHGSAFGRAYSEIYKLFESEFT